MITDRYLSGRQVCTQKTILPKKSSECVVLLHGLGRTRRSMRKIEKRLRDTGFDVWNRGYPSRSATIKSLAQSRITEAVAFCVRKKAAKIHFVTHSMGGILVRMYLQKNQLPAKSRIVMLSPPNHGSEVVDRFKNFPVFKWLYGPAGQELGTQARSIPGQLRPVQADIGVIAGKKSSGIGFSMIIPGKNDGTVSVASARLAEMNDFITVECGHTFIMKNRNVIDQTVFYLRNGHFRH